MTNPTSTGAAERKPLTGRITLIAVTIAAVLAVILILEGRVDKDVPESSPPPSSQVYQAAASALDSTENNFEFPPAEWLQASGSSTGNAAWAPAVKSPFDTLWILRTGSEIFSPPAVLGDFIYTAGNDRVLRGLNRHTGDQIWSRTVTCGLSGGVAADSQLVFFPGQDGYLYAIGRADGSEEWKSGLGYHIFTDAAVFADTLVLAGNSMGSVAALDRATGEPVWSDTMEGLVIGPAVSDSTAVFCTEAGEAAAWNPSGTLLWSRSFTSQPSAPSIGNNLVFIGFSSGKLLAISLVTGETVWETALQGVRGRTVVSRPSLSADSRVVAGTCDGRVFCTEAQNGSILWETPLPNWVTVSPAVCDTIVYASCDDGRIYLLSLNTGLPVDTIETGSYSGTPPILLEGVLYAGNSAGDLVALAGTVPSDSTESETNCPAE